MTRLGLKAYKNFLAMSLTTKDWAVTDTHEEYRPRQISDIRVRGTEEGTGGKTVTI